MKQNVGKTLLAHTVNIMGLIFARKIVKETETADRHVSWLFDFATIKFCFAESQLSGLQRSLEDRSVEVVMNLAL